MIIGIIGYGKMGQAVEKQSLTRGHSFILLSSLDPLRSHGFDAVDCVIDFSHADVAENAIRSCLKAGKPVVSGTTGWNDGVRSVGTLCEELEGAFCWSPNFSIGMQITFHLNRTLAKIMNDLEHYSPEILEVHHTDKKDAPSGTSIALADDVLFNIDRLSEWELIENSDVLLAVVILIVLTFLVICLIIFYCCFFPDGIPDHLKEDKKSEHSDDEKDEMMMEDGDKADAANGNGT